MSEPGAAQSPALPEHSHLQDRAGERNVLALVSPSPPVSGTKNQSRNSSSRGCTSGLHIWLCMAQLGCQDADRDVWPPCRAPLASRALAPALVPFLVTFGD